MPHVINIGSINIDHVYQVPHFVNPGETLASQKLTTVLGGKGANQSVALAQAGVSVAHVGRVNQADDWAVELLQAKGVDITHIARVDAPSGHAIIQVDAQGENAIVLHGGANQGLTLEQLEAVLKADACDYLLLQNECNLLPEILAMAHERKLRTVLNPAPMTAIISALPLNQLDTLIVNEGEARTLVGGDDVNFLLDALPKRLPDTRVVLTLGSQGAWLLHQGERLHCAASPVTVVDTTGAGDTFVGYLLAGLLQGLDDGAALSRACRAAALAVTRLGAITSIPALSEL